MGKYLSCFKSQNVSSTCVNETGSTSENKSDKLGSNVSELELRKASEHGTHSSVSNSNVISGLYRRVHANRSISNHNESPEELTTLEDRLKKPSITNKTKHFSPFFQTKILNTCENDGKMKQRADVLLESKINALFEKYSDADEKDMILMEGVEKLCFDLNLQPDDFKILILAWKFNAEQMCQFTRQEFISGCKEMKTENLSQMQSKLSEIAASLKTDHPQFKNLYRFTFKFGLDKTVGQRILPIDMAICLWKLVFTLHKPPILDRWLPFLQSDQAHIRGIPRDTWNMFLNFSETVGEDLSSYDDAEAWPSIFDDFVEYEKDRVNQNLIPCDSSVSNLTSCDEKPRNPVR